MAKAKKPAKKAQQAKKQQAEVPVLTVDHGTSATRKRLRPDPIDEYAEAMRLRGDDCAGEKESAAREIRRVYEMVTAGLWSKAVDMNGVRGKSEPVSEWLAIAHRDRYKPWADEVGKSQNLMIVLDWLVDEHSFRQIDRRLRQRDGTTRAVLDAALVRYAEIAGWIARSRRVAA